jgi:CBS domain-containing protein
MLYDRRMGCLLVVEDAELKGIITTTDMLKLLVHLLRKQDAVSGGLAGQ